MDDDLHFWTVIGLDEARVPELKRLEKLLIDLQQEPSNEDKLLNSTDALIRILENLCKNAYPVFKTIDLQSREILIDCVSTKWYHLRKELKRVLPHPTWKILYDHAQAFTKLCQFDFDLRPLLFAKQSLIYKDMPIDLESELIKLIEKMTKQHPKMLDDLLKEEYEQIKNHHQKQIVITVLGSTKSSKSSLINFLLEDEICPTENRAATARLTRITYGERIRLTVTGSQHQSYVFDNTRQLLAKAQEVIILKNEDRKSRLCQDEVFIELPIEELRGLELWDVPGFDENHVINTRITEILKDTDLILAVLSQQESLRQTAIDFIKPSLQQQQQQQQEKNRPQTKICFIISQIDRFKPDEQSNESREQFLQHIYEKICTELPTNFPKIDYRESDQFIPMCSSPRHSVKDYLECRAGFIKKSSQWFSKASHRLTYQRTDLLLKSVSEFANYETLFLQQTRYQHMREIFNERFIQFSEKLSEEVKKKLHQIQLIMRQSVEDIVGQCRELFYQSESLETIEAYIQEQLARKFPAILALENPQIIQMISQMCIEFSNTIELKPPEIQLLKQVLNKTLSKDYHSNIIGQYHHTSPYHLSAYFNRIFHALSETLKATVQIPLGNFGEMRKAYEQFILREKYLEEKTGQSIGGLVNDVLDIISDKIQRETEKTVKGILANQLEQIHRRIEEQVRKYLHSSSTDTKIDHLRQFFKENSLQIKQMHLDVLDLQFQLDFSSNCQINLEERLDQNHRFPVFSGTLGETKVAVAAKLIPLKDFRLQEVLYIREVKHKHVIRYYGVKKGFDDRYYLLMPRLDCNLTRYLNDHSGTFDPQAIDDMIVQIIKGLDYIHRELEFVHRQIELENILVNRRKNRFLIGHLGGGVHQQSGDYAAPEFASTNVVSEKCDVFSLGIVIKEIVRLADIQGPSDAVVDVWLKLSKICCVEKPAARPTCRKLLDNRFRRAKQ